MAPPKRGHHNHNGARRQKGGPRANTACPCRAMLSGLRIAAEGRRMRRGTDYTSQATPLPLGAAPMMLILGSWSSISFQAQGTGTSRGGRRDELRYSFGPRSVLAAPRENGARSLGGEGGRGYGGRARPAAHAARRGVAAAAKRSCAMSARRSSMSLSSSWSSSRRIGRSSSMRRSCWSPALRTAPRFSPRGAAEPMTPPRPGVLDRQA